MSGTCCTRAQKEAYALRDRGWTVESLSCEAPSDSSMFAASSVVPARRLASCIARSGAAIIHVHNSPDSLMRAAVKGARGRPIVYDCHDLAYYHGRRVRPSELFAFAHADAIVHVSAEHRDVAYALHPWTCPEAVVMSCPPRAWAPPSRSERAGVVYEGGIVRPGLPRMDWRDLSPVTAAFAAAGVPLDLYVRRSVSVYYPNVKGLLPYRRLLRRLTRYLFGWLGTDAPSPKWQVAIPNKLWDYAAAGVVPIACNAPAAARAIGEGAILASSAADALEQLRVADPDDLRSRLRPRYMDDEIAGVVALYEALS